MKQFDENVWGAYLQAFFSPADQALLATLSAFRQVMHPLADLLPITLNQARHTKSMHVCTIP